MSSILRADSHEGKLNESWEEIQFPSSQPATPPEQQQSGPYPATLSNAVLRGQMEKLLLDAQRDSSRGSSSRGSIASSRGSPRSPDSPNTEPTSLELCVAPKTKEEDIAQSGENHEKTEWMDWASRPEKVPPSDYHRFFRHKRSPTSLRNTTVMKGGPFRLENLPLLIMTHACTFFLGAAAMFMYLKKYWSFTSLSSTVAN